MGSEPMKPVVVAVGQHWVENDDKATPYTVKDVRGDRAQIVFDDGQNDGHWHTLTSILEDRYLGMSDTPPAPVGVVPAAGQCWRDLRGEYFGGAAFTLREPYRGLGWWTVETKGRNWIPSHAFGHAFAVGRLECLGRPTASVTPGTPMADEAPLPVVHSRFVGERRDLGTGAALSCLQHIQARKPPEPWKPSIDDWDLLPDAGR